MRRDDDDPRMPDSAPEPPPEYNVGKRKRSAAVTPASLYDDGGLPANVEAEKTILGAILLDNQAFDESSEAIEPEDFSLDAHQRIYRHMSEMLKEKHPVDLVTLSNDLMRTKELEAVNGVSYLASLTEGLPRRPVIDEYILILKDRSMLRGVMAIGNSSFSRAQDQSEPAIEIAAAALSQLEAIVKKGTDDSAERAGAYLRRVHPDPQDLIRKTAKDNGIDPGFSDLYEMTSGFQKGELIVLAGRPSMGKALSLDCPVKTIDGWKRNGSLQIGDRLAAIDAVSSFVTGIFPQGPRQLYNVTFSDGRTIETDMNHLWTVHYREWESPRVIDTFKLIEMLGRARYKNRLWIDVPSGDFGKQYEGRLHPWVIGAILGNGNTTQAQCRFSSADQFTVDKLRALLPPGTVVKSQGKDGWRINGIASDGQLLMRVLLSDLELWGRRAEQKFIPKILLEADRQTRIDLLSGLMDTDGNVETFGSLVYSTSSRQLAQDVQELARSLGAFCSISNRPEPEYSNKGEKCIGLPAFRLYISHADCAQFITLPRKKERAKGKSRIRRVTFSSIEPSRIAEAQCITVSHPSQLFIADHGYIVTHNSALAFNIAEHVAVNCETPTLFFPLEVGKDALMRRGICSRARVPLQAHRKGLMNAHQQEEFASAYEEIERAPLYLDDKARTIPAIRRSATRLKSRGLLDFMIIDQLSFLETAAKDRLKNMIREQEVSGYTRSLKNLARELNVPILLVCHLKRDVANRSDKTPTLVDLRESGSIEQDADVVMFVHRPGYYDKADTTIQKKGQIIVAKQRDGPTDTIEVEFDGSIVRWSDPVDPNEINQRLLTWG